jgi:hypothetical protein
MYQREKTMGRIVDRVNLGHNVTFPFGGPLVPAAVGNNSEDDTMSGS